MTSIVDEIKEYLKTYRHTDDLQLQHLSIEDVATIKGMQVRNPKLLESDYQRSWAKLAKAQRLNRLMNYHQKLTRDYNLDCSAQQQLKTLFYDGINSDVLNVQYNICEGHITKIDGLKRDTNGIFYIDSSTNIPPVAVSIKFTPVTSEQLSVAQKKKKPLIILKKMN
jgi:hypothetical protein